MRRNRYQIALVVSLVVLCILLCVFIYRELFPEYKQYQDVYVALEEYRSSYTKEKPKPFKKEIKQLVVTNALTGKEEVDRCMSCHVAVKSPHYSPTKIVYTVNGDKILDAYGVPLKEANPDYIWSKLEKTIAHLRDEKVNQTLKEKEENLQKALALESLLTLDVGGKKVNMKKVLSMHPLLGAEIRPFEEHPLDEYGCCSCHSGDGKSVVAAQAHGPVFDGTYETDEKLREPLFLERDRKNDPKFASMFNAKPGKDLLSQTTPILIGPLMQSKCMDCHESSRGALNHLVDTVNVPLNRKKKQVDTIKQGIVSDKKTLSSLITLMRSLKWEGYEPTLKNINDAINDWSHTHEEVLQLKFQLKYLKAFNNALKEWGVPEKEHTHYMIRKMHLDLEGILGSKELTTEFEKNSKGQKNLEKYVDEFIEKHKGKETKYTLYGKIKMQNTYTEAIDDYEQANENLAFLAEDKKTVKNMASFVEPLISNYKRGAKLFISQGCYTCHRIDGYSSASLGPDLTHIGLSDPWYIKLSIVWPQGKSKSATMPTFKLDPQDVQDLMSFLLAQKGRKKNRSAFDPNVSLKDGVPDEKLPWEEAIDPSQMLDLNYAMTIFATEGCASCHKIQGFDGNVGFNSEGEPFEEENWFMNLFPEQISGYQLVEVLDKHASEIDEKLVKKDKGESILEKLQITYPKLIESFYSNFQYAERAKNEYYQNLIDETKDETLRKHYGEGLDGWKARVNKVLIMYIQTYGLGRDIAPHLSWSGIYRDNEWLMGHFMSPTDFIPRSFMPPMPFDQSKFYSLINMLHLLGKKNRDKAALRWDTEGFNPALAYEFYCAECHGDSRRGNGPISSMLYPIPKNLRNTTFLLNLTKERAIESITHGVEGTPMAPWGEVIPEKQLGDQIPVLTQGEIKQLVDWLYEALPNETLVRASEIVPKWNYTALDVIKELNLERGDLQALPIDQPIDKKSSVEAYFDVRAGSYMIKERFYTQDNIEAGKQLFLDNCAVCHGSEGSGMGVRAAYMVEAKPRMLTNLPWIHSKDDLFLLRAIKFGVPGTSMTPWGDQTSVLQRMQMVLFIRSLSEEKDFSDTLNKLDYNTFVNTELLIEEVRGVEYPALNKAREKFNRLHERQSVLYEEVERGVLNPEVAGSAYAEQLSARNDLKKLEARDQILVDLIEEIKVEAKIYKNCGLDLIDKKPDPVLIKTFFDMIKTHGMLFELKEGHLSCLESESYEVERRKKLEDLFKVVGVLMKSAEQKIEKYKALSQSEEVVKEIEKIKRDVDNLKLIVIIVAEKEADAIKSRKKQLSIYKKYE